MSTYKTKWDAYLTTVRLSGKSASEGDSRTEFERDQDRVIFSTPFRRLSDKTQVFPLDNNDGVRTRLTHSYEVANLAWNLGVKVCTKGELSKLFSGQDHLVRVVPPILKTVGLIHDLGNPPFGHSGEDAIGSWFDGDRLEGLGGVGEGAEKDLQNFEGNAQALRLITRLQNLDPDVGIDLTCASIASLVKYPHSSEDFEEKYGFFKSEEELIKKVWEKTMLEKGKRHPLSLLMEACDDIAYSVLDIEDSIRKEIFSVHDLINYLKKKNEEKKEGDSESHDRIINSIIKLYDEKIVEYRGYELHSQELNIVLMERLRAHIINEFINAVANKFDEEFSTITEGTLPDKLIKLSDAAYTCKCLKSLARELSYQNVEVVKKELVGHKTIKELMDFLWTGISAIDKGVKTPQEAFALKKVSRSYLRVYSSSDKDIYSKYRLLIDMISGMTDSFAISLHREFSELYGAKYE